MTVVVQRMAGDELLALAVERRDAVRAFIDWAERQEAIGSSMYLANRSDIPDAREAGALYPQAWWGVVVFTCFGSLNSTRAVRDILEKPIGEEAATELLESIHFARPTVGHHRIQQGLLGAKKALVAACRYSELLHQVLNEPGTFDDRYRRLRAADLARWGRTTCFDFLLRTGALAIGGQCYRPELAYLAGSTGPKAGFRAVWGRNVTDGTAPWCEGLLQAWERHWPAVVDLIGSHWSGQPYAPGDMENALCIYQERRS